MPALTERATFAGVLVTLVRQRCAETGTSRTSRTGLQLRVPVEERPAVRRGLDALIEHGLLGSSGGDIGLTARGLVLLEHYRRLSARQTHAGDEGRGESNLREVLSVVEGDSRFDPDHTIEAVSTLPGRFEQYGATRRHSRMGKVWLVFGLIVMLVAAALYLRAH